MIELKNLKSRRKEKSEKNYELNYYYMLSTRVEICTVRYISEKSLRYKVPGGRRKR